MRDSGREALVGYLLGALEEPEQKEVESQLAENPRLRDDLAKIGTLLKPLDAARTDYDPPAGLAARTMAFIDEQMPRPATKRTEKRTGSAAPTETTRRGHMSEVPEQLGRGGRFRWQDILAACALTLSGVLLLIPAINSSRATSRLLACEDNLQHLGLGLGQYSQLNAGLFPAVPSSGKLAVAGAYAPQLLNAGLIDSPRRIVCPSSSLADKRDFKGVTVPQIMETKDGKKLLILHRLMGGSYGYHLGHVKGDKLQPTKNQHRTHFAMMSDAPSPKGPNHATLNHDGKGQNVLYEDGSVHFVSASGLRKLNEDIFTNDEGEVEAGKHENDSVVAPSDATPFLRLRIRFQRPTPEAAGPAK